MNSYPTYKIVLDTRRPLKDGTYPVKVRITYRRKAKYYRTPYYLSEKDFIGAYTKKAQPKEPHLRKIRVHLRNIERHIEEIIYDSPHFSHGNFEEKFMKDSISGEKDLHYYFETNINDNNLSESTRELAKLSYKAVASALGVKTLKDFGVDRISPKELIQIHRYLLDKGCSETTISIYMRVLRKLFNAALRENVITLEQYPFGNKKYKPPKVRKRKSPLRPIELKRLMEFDASKNHNIELAKNFFLLSLFLEGMNIADILHLKNENLKGNWIKYYRRKTRTTLGTLEERATFINSEAMNIIAKYRQESRKADDYIINLIKHNMDESEQRTTVKNFTRKLNQHLKTLAQFCEIETKLTTVVARHTWVSFAFDKFGAEETRKRIGHADMKSTQHYLESLVSEESSLDFGEILSEIE